MKTVSVQIISKSNFAKCVGYAKKAGGKFDPATKTWAIPADRAELNAPAAYGWKIVSAAVPAASPADTYRGQASMDHPDSIF
jgi:hypothetical protein